MKNLIPIKKKSFTLIEVIISIVVIGVLAAIVLPNISGFKEESTTAAMQSTIKNLETAVTMYSLDNHGKLPTATEPSLGLPQPLLLNKLHPDHIRNMPKVKGMNYWVDYSGKVWASSADSPLGVYYESSGKLSWQEVENAVTYSVFKASENAVTSSANKLSLTFISNTNVQELDLPELKAGEFYLVNSTDNFGLESPPASSEYQGYTPPLPAIGDLEPGVSQKEPFGWPMNMSPPTWKNSDPSLRDGDDTTALRINSGEEFLLEWNGDMANRVFQMEFRSDIGTYSGTKTFAFVDAEGKELPFINAKTDAPYANYTFQRGIPKTAIDFIVPRGAVKLKVYGQIPIDLYKADFVKDLSLPQPVSNVTSTVTSESITLNWDIPTGENFLKAAIYADGKFVGYGEEGVFTHKPLYSNKEYNYFLEPVSIGGNRGQRIYHTNTTVSKEINWRGFSDASAFDSTTTTAVLHKNDDEVTWIGDLANRQITIKHSSSYRYNSFNITFFNEKEEVVPSLIVSDKNRISLATHVVNMSESLVSTSFVVPEDAVKFKFTNMPYNNYFHDISHGNTLALPTGLNGITTSSTTESITFNFNKPSDVVKVGVFREGKFIAYTAEDTFTDTALLANKTYNYTFETFNATGNRNGNAGEANETTGRPPIIWGGLADGGAFDSSMTTYSSLVKGSVVTWEGDMVDRQVNITHSGNYRYGNFSMAFYNDAGVVVNSKLANSNTATGVHLVESVETARTVSFVVPAGATKFMITNSSYNLRFYNVSQGSTLELPNKLTSVSAEPTTESVTLSFVKPADITRVGVWRDGVFLAYVTENMYTDRSLHSDREYKYTFETFNAAGNRLAVAGEVTTRTKATEIIWRGLNDGAAFDSSLTTHTFVSTGQEVSWVGDLTDRQITIRHSGSYRYGYFAMAFYDANNQIVNSKLANSNVPIGIHEIDSNESARDTSFVVPAGATKFRLTTANYSLRFYNVSQGTTLALPSKLTNVAATSNSESITLNFNKPSDVARVAVYRNGTFLAFTTGDTYTDTSLFSDMEYTYTFETFNAAGNRTADGGVFKYKTQRDEAVWRGLPDANAFDSSMSTFTVVPKNAEITWAGAFANRQLNITHSNSYTYAEMRITFYNDSNVIIPSALAGTTSNLQYHTVKSNNTARTTSFFIPEGATKFKVSDFSFTQRFFNVDVQ